MKGNTLYWVHPDHLGRPEMVTNSAKQRVWRAANLAFERNVLLDQIGGYNFGFPGQYWDVESGVWQNGFRDYEQTLGRYLQSDPIGLGGGLSTYGYGGANPTIFVDPLGLYCLSEPAIRAIAGGLAGSLAGAYAGSAGGPGTAAIFAAIGGLAGAGLGYLDGLQAEDGRSATGLQQGISGGVSGIVGAYPGTRAGISGGLSGGVVGSMVGGSVESEYGRGSGLIVGGLAGGSFSTAVATFFSQNKGVLVSAARGGGVGAVTGLIQYGLEQTIRVGNDCSCGK